MDEDWINFGPLPQAVDVLLQEGVIAYRQSPDLAARLFQKALSSTPNVLPVYFCLYKIYTYQKQLAHAETAARLGLAEAQRQLGWSENMEEWPPLESDDQSPARFIFYTLKALSFIKLKAGKVAEASYYLSVLRRCDPRGTVGWPLIGLLLEGTQPDAPPLREAPALSRENGRGWSKRHKASKDATNPTLTGNTLRLGEAANVARV